MEGGGEKEGEELEEGCVVPACRCCALPTGHSGLLVGRQDQGGGQPGGEEAGVECQGGREGGHLLEATAGED